MELKHYLRMLQAGWWIIALTVLAAISFSLAGSYLATPIYRARARLVVKPNVTVIGTGNLVDSLNTLDKRSIASTYAEVLTSNRIQSEAATALHIEPTVLQNYPRTATLLPDSNILEVSVSGPDPNIAAQLANGIGQRGIVYIQGFYQVFTVDFLDPAIADNIPVSPQPIRDVSIAIGLGLVVGAALALVREQLRLPLEALRQRSMYDSTSSALSHHYFMRRLEEELARKRGGVLSIGLVQLEGLDGLSDTLPPMVFQGLLRRVTHSLQTELRGRDSVGRWSEITFSLLLPATQSTATVRTLERIQQVLSNPIPLDEHSNEEVRLDPYIGATTSTGNEPIKIIIERAQVALERAEQSGNAPVVFVE
ncbi:hypothetical protein ANRL3_00793 [Anaerolineae bacterium]|nr:hypothetical protein ANRL3_00793 [Anaerolineae bacterium]